MSQIDWMELAGQMRRRINGNLRDDENADYLKREVGAELETLKAQLCVKDMKIEGQRVRHLELEAQVRELRELLRYASGYVDYQARRYDEIQAALRSAPPSALPELKLTESQKTWCRENMQTDAGEERKDLAKVPAVSDGFTDAREIRENVRASPTADKSVEYSTPQDSPSRSEWISVETKLPKGGFVLAWLAGAERGNAIMITWFDVDRKRFSAPDVTHWQPLPPSPAREKEKAE